MKKILQIGNNVLRKTAQEVAISDIKSTETQEIIKEMSRILSKEEDGVAIAAPQIGYSKRIFVVADKIFEGEEGSPEKIFINPKITNLSKEKTLVDEGCLSVRWKYGRVRRSSKVTIKAYNKEGKKFQRGASGLLAQIFQHETDHLDGVLFVDKADDLKEYIPKDIKNEK
ncbi:MAG TPA: peptide deformylase [Candidatus Paceibacterota bacterium]|jgi:peptide deformylase|nr:peptide deformylase [Parcubacteria group bacterium]MDP6119627.1 peptide deformylase [Candidatus Paceibacterota bacterium]HJN62629.1 peptide deformylase [Candidatus Paceibacterota bacterium]|tara:strand:- start:1265 stop:1774 length:510 start_codon:yes stop_codon:yes gene_type:complete